MKKRKKVKVPVTRAAVLLEGLVTAIAAGTGSIESVLEEVGAGALRDAAIDRLLRADLSGLEVALVHRVLETVGTEPALGRLRTLLSDPARPRHVLARLAELVAYIDRDAWWAVGDGPLAALKARETLFFEGECERELTMFQMGSRTPADLAQLVADLPEGWREACFLALNRVRARLGLAPSRIFAAILEHPALTMLRGPMAMLLALESSPDSTALLNRVRALDPMLETARTIATIIRAAPRARAPVRGEAWAGRPDGPGSNLALVALGRGDEARQLYLLDLRFDGRGVELGRLEMPAEMAPLLANKVLTDAVRAPLEALLAFAATVAEDGLEGSAGADLRVRAEFRTLLPAPGAPASVARGEPFDYREAVDFWASDALASWELSPGLRLAFVEECARAATGHPLEETGETHVYEHVARALRYAAHWLCWSGRAGLAGRLVASAAELERAPLVAITWGLTQRELRKLQTA